MSKKGFTHTALYRKKEPRFAAVHYMKAKSSFWIAAIALVAFVAGNMIGQHGVSAFWASVLGKVDESLLTYDGVVTPIEYVPDYDCWAKYGGSGNSQLTYRELPEKCRVPMPSYDITQTSEGSAAAQRTYSVAYMGGYDGTNVEDNGSHLGIDIRSPIGTPVRSIMNGVVTAVKEDKGGFGLYVVVMHKAPDPTNPTKNVELYSIYAHLSAQLVIEGQAVSKGAQIGLVGMTGNASGPHLHFQIDRGDAPWHPYWPFTSKEASDAKLSFVQAINTGLHKERGYQYTVNPMAYVQAKYAPVGGTVIVQGSSSVASSLSASVRSTTTLQQTIARQRAEQLRAQRIARILARRTAVQVIDANQAAAYRSTAIATGTTDNSVVAPSSSSSSTSTSSSSASVPGVVPADVRFELDASYSGIGVKVVHVLLVDANGVVVMNPQLTSPVMITTAYGDATFDKESLTASDFVNGIATVRMYPQGTRTIVVGTLQYPTVSSPMVYKKD